MTDLEEAIVRHALMSHPMPWSVHLLTSTVVDDSGMVVCRFPRWGLADALVRIAEELVRIPE